jgi:hypothetical protein
VCENDDLSADVNPATGNAEGINLRQIDQVKAEIQFCRGQVLNQPVAELAQVGSQLVVLNNVYTQGHGLSHGVAEVNLLLIRKHVFGRGYGLQAWW